MWRNLNHLVNSAPHFNGTQEVDLWKAEMLRYLRQQQVTDAHMRANVIIGSLEDTARTWFGSLSELEVDDEDEASILSAIAHRFGKSELQRITTFNNLKQNSGETLSKYADRVRQASYGLSKTVQEVVLKFYSTLTLSH